MAYYDDLTGLPNRRLFRDAIAEYLNAGDDPSRVLVLMLNVDRFKIVSGSLGQDIGDMLLLTLAGLAVGAVAGFIASRAAR